MVKVSSKRAFWSDNPAIFSTREHTHTRCLARLLCCVCILRTSLRGLWTYCCNTRHSGFVCVPQQWPGHSSAHQPKTACKEADIPRVWRESAIIALCIRTNKERTVLSHLARRLFERRRRCLTPRARKRPHRLQDLGLCSVRMSSGPVVWRTTTLTKDLVSKPSALSRCGDFCSYKSSSQAVDHTVYTAAFEHSQQCKCEEKCLVHPSFFHF